MTTCQVKAMRSNYADMTHVASTSAQSDEPAVENA